MNTQHEIGAGEFLAKYGIRLTITPTGSGNCPPFCDGKHIHGDEHRVTISRNSKRIQFYFWNSFMDAKDGKRPDAYDVLACASSDINCPDTFEDFCDEYGYDTDSRKAEQTFKACSAQSKRLNQLFDSEEMQADLSTIN